MRKQPVRLQAKYVRQAKELQKNLLVEGIKKSLEDCYFQVRNEEETFNAMKKITDPFKRLKL